MKNSFLALIVCLAAPAAPAAETRDISCWAYNSRLNVTFKLTESSRPYVLMNYGGQVFTGTCNAVNRAYMRHSRTILDCHPNHPTRPLIQLHEFRDTAIGPSHTATAEFTATHTLPLKCQLP
ncbi:MAG TPA: hypothetical protein VFV50_04200 [Bdellovibrionales bacterium]|nr:hypothetical protein [Bdellovibrionales bacterium]